MHQIRVSCAGMQAATKVVVLWIAIAMPQSDPSSSIIIHQSVTDQCPCNISTSLIAGDKTDRRRLSSLDPQTYDDD